MADISREELQKEINVILKDADLTVTSAKKVRQQLEQKLGCNLLSRKKEIDKLLMEYIDKNEKNNESEEEEKDVEEEEKAESENEESEEEKKPKKRPAPGRKAPAKKRKSNANGSASEDNGSDEEGGPKKGSAKSKRGAQKKKANSGSDEDWKRPKAAKKAGAGKGRGTGFTRAYTLSPALAALMGADSLPRHEVVKKMWAMIKERNLYDPKNKQFAICDTDLIKVMGVKRFRTFGMLKYLKQHFID